MTGETNLDVISPILIRNIKIECLAVCSSKIDESQRSIQQTININEQALPVHVTKIYVLVIQILITLLVLPPLAIFLI